MKDKLKIIRKGGRVERFHTIPTTGNKQTVATHSWGVASLMIELFPKDAENLELLKACLYHDVAECLVGDVPAPTKWRFKQMAELHLEAEQKILKETGFEWTLSYRENYLLKIVDMLELLFYTVEQKQMGNTYFNKVFSNSIDYLSGRICAHGGQLSEEEETMLRKILKDMTEKCG